MDTFGTIDAYLKLEYMGKTLKTEVITQKKGETGVLWDQEMWIPVQLPIVTDRIVMKIYDYDTTSDEIVASMVFHLKDYIEKGHSGKFFWSNLYGAPLDVSGDTTNLMNANPEVASNWKGRVFM